jgi:uncharacterized membrane protein
MENKSLSSIIRKAAVYFFQGALFTIPVAITFYFLFEILVTVGSAIDILGIKIHPLIDPFLGVILVVVSLIIIGAVGSIIFFRPIFIFLDKSIEKAPLIKTIYSSIKDLMSAFVGQKKRFNKPVLVRMNDNPVIEKLGYVTNEDLSDLNISKDKIAVYLPFSYAFTGNLIIVSKECITPLNTTSADLMKFIISGGVTEID